MLSKFFYDKSVPETYLNFKEWEYSFVYPVSNGPVQFPNQANFCGKPLFNGSTYHRIDKPLIVSAYHNQNFIGKRLNQYALFNGMLEHKYTFYTSNTADQITNLDTIIEVLSYDNFGSPTAIKKIGEPVKMQYRDYAQNFIVEATNCLSNEVSVTYTTVDLALVPGNYPYPKIFDQFYYLITAGPQSFSKPNTNKDCFIDYYYFDVASNTWKYKKESFVGPIMSLNYPAVNFVRIYPKDAFITTKYLHPVFGVLASEDANGKVMSYEYDGFGRLAYIRDFKGYITNEYQYKP